ncbi:hypothetical protein IW152_006144, partial [Coemansia sp. BCRC 34962]
PLLWVSHNLWAAAYPRFCHSSEISLTSLSFGDLGEHYLKIPQTHVDYRHRNYLGYSTHRMAKSVTIFLDELGVLTGKALVMLSSAPYDGCAFPLARKLTLILVNMEEDVIEEHSSVEDDSETDEDTE